MRAVTTIIARRVTAFAQSGTTPLIAKPCSAVASFRLRPDDRIDGNLEWQGSQEGQRRRGKAQHENSGNASPIRAQLCGNAPVKGEIADPSSLGHVDGISAAFVKPATACSSTASARPASCPTRAMTNAAAPANTTATVHAVLIAAAPATEDRIAIIARPAT